MNELYYNYIKNKYENNKKLLFTNTDNWVYEIETVNVYDDFSKNKEMLSFSNYFAKSEYSGHSNALFIGTVKPLNSRYLRVLKSFSVIERGPLLGGLLKRLLRLGLILFTTIHGMSAIWDVRYWDVSL